MPESLSLRFFGPPLVGVQGEPLPRLRSRKGLLLLALLALRNGTAMERDFLIGTLWPESDGLAGQESLRKTLGDLRAALGAEAQRLSTPRRGTLLLDLSGDVFCDTTAYDSAIARWEKSGDIAQAELAVSLYRGPFLEGVTEDWVLRERLLREESARAVLEVLARCALERGDSARALALVRRAEKIEPLRESVQRLLFRALAESGDFPAAQRAFRDFRIRLHSEASLSPDPETVALMQALTKLSRRISMPEAELTQESSAPTISAGLRHFPHFLTPLHGRARDQSRLQDALRTAPLTTLVGMGGMGKTRLAVFEAERWPHTSFADLAPLPRSARAEDVLGVLFRAVGIAGEEALAQLREHLYESDILLVLDNGEPVLGALRTALNQLLQSDQKARVLVTSREPLGLRGEQVIRLEPLSNKEAIQLFQERAEAAGTSLPPEETEILGAICQRLEGLPLAIELAAARVALLSPTRLLERLDAPLRLLSGGHLDLPERQRSLRAVLEDSFTLLNPEEQSALVSLAVFVGAFHLEDAESVLEAGESEPLDQLEALHRASFLISRPTGWTFLQPVRDFATEQLRGIPKREKRARLRHAQHQAAVAEEAIAQSQRGSMAAERRLWERAEDRSAAFSWAEQAGESLLAARLAYGHLCYLRVACRYREAELLLEQALPLASDQTLLQKLLTFAAWLRLDTGDAVGAQQRLEQALALGNPSSALLQLQGVLAFYQGRSAEARLPTWAAFEAAMAEKNPLEGARILNLYTFRILRGSETALRKLLAEDLEQARQKVEALLKGNSPPQTTVSALTILHRLQKDETRSVPYLEQAISLYKRQNQREQLADTQLQLAQILFRIGHPDEAERAVFAAAQGHRALGNDEAARQVLVNGLCHAKFTRWFGQAIRLRDALAPELGALDPTYRARAILFEGCVLMRYSPPEQARARLHEAAERFRWLGDLTNETILRRLMVWTYLDEGDLERTKTEAQQLLDNGVVVGIDEVHRRAVLLAECLRRQGNPKAALSLLEPLALAHTPEAHPARGLCALDLGDMERAETEFQAAVTIGEVELSIEWLAYSSLGLATVAQRRGQLEAAQAGYQAVLAQALRAEDRVAERLVRAGLHHAT